MQLEGHELSYLRAIGIVPHVHMNMSNVISGVIILSAVLKRRMMLADQAKSLFISKSVTLHHTVCQCLICIQYIPRTANTSSWSQL